MRIAILSDSHDNIWKLEKALYYMKEADVVLHCGDIISPFMINIFINGVCKKPVHMIWGNNDGDKRMLSEIASNADNIFTHGDFADLDFNGFKVAMIHYPTIAHGLAEANKYDMVCYGHDHTAYHSIVGKTTLINPGELMGMNEKSTFAIFDIISKEIDFIEVT